jgi:hypothetical protein
LEVAANLAMEEYQSHRPPDANIQTCPTVEAWRLPDQGRSDYGDRSQCQQPQPASLFMLFVARSFHWKVLPASKPQRSDRPSDPKIGNRSSVCDTSSSRTPRPGISLPTNRRLLGSGVVTGGWITRRSYEDCRRRWRAIGATGKHRIVPRRTLTLHIESA